jgi:transcriptional regulator with XRE-family HTH domain
MAEKSQPFRFGSMIRDARKAQGLALAQLAARASVNPHAVWEIETQGGGRMKTVTDLMAVLDLRQFRRTWWYPATQPNGPRLHDQCGSLLLFLLTALILINQRPALEEAG